MTDDHEWKLEKTVWSPVPNLVRDLWVCPHCDTRWSYDRLPRYTPVYKPPENIQPCEALRLQTARRVLDE